MGQSQRACLRAVAGTIEMNLLLVVPLVILAIELIAMAVALWETWP
jgi:hypothetical protein